MLALYNYVTRLRYVAVPLGVNSFRPHAAANVLQNQFGDCKDKANLFNTLLHSHGDRGAPGAGAALQPGARRAAGAVLQSCHLARDAGRPDTMWVDTTDDVCRFGMLPPGDPGPQSAGD